MKANKSFLNRLNNAEQKRAQIIESPKLVKLNLKPRNNPRLLRPEAKRKMENKKK